MAKYQDTSDPLRAPGELITDAWLFVACDPENGGAEGLVGFSQNGRTWAPMVITSRARLELMIPIAASIAKESKRAVRLIRLTGREVIEEYEP